MDGNTSADAGRAAIWLLQELVTELAAQGALNGTNLHDRLLSKARDERLSADRRAESYLAASVVEHISTMPHP